MQNFVAVCRTQIFIFRNLIFSVEYVTITLRHHPIYTFQRYANLRIIFFVRSSRVFGSYTVPAELDARKVWVVSQPGNGMLYAVPRGAAFFMENTIDESKIFDALQALILNLQINYYAVERVAFGYEKPGDRVPVDLYLQDLHLNITDVRRRSDIHGIYIDGQERINAELYYSEYVRELFVMQTERIFIDAPKDIRMERDGEELAILPRFREYVFGLLPLFTEILNTDVKYDAFDVMPTPTERTDEYENRRKFVTAILIKPLRSGSRIDRYVKDFTDAPQYIRRLIEKKGKNYFLKPLDMNSYEYAFALFSLMRFMNGENGKLFELKMREWERKKAK